MPSSDAAADALPPAEAPDSTEPLPPWSTGTPGWAKNVRSPNRRRSSRFATWPSAEFPPCPLTNSSRVMPEAANDRPMSTSVAMSVSHDSQMEPGNAWCSSDLVNASPGSSTTGTSATSTAAEAIEHAVT